MSKFSTWINIGAILVVCAASTAQAVAPTDEQKCKVDQLKALANYYSCQLKAEGKAFKSSTVADLTQCNEDIHNQFAKIERKYGSLTPGGCTEGDVARQAYLISKAQRESTDMACLVTQEAGIDRGGTVTFVDFAPDNNPTTLSVRSTENVPILQAKCFYADDLCVASPEFLIDIPAQGATTWDPSNPPGGIPPLPTASFAGYLVCVETDETGLPLAGNALIASVADQYRCRVDGVIIRAFENDSQAGIANSQLCLGSASSTACPNGAELDPCPYDLFSGTPFKPRMEGCWSAVSSFTYHCQP